MKRIFVVLALPLFFAACTSYDVSDSVSYDSATLQNVTRITDDGIYKDWARISPDGNKILYCESESTLRWSDISSEWVTSYKIVLLKDAAKSAKTPLINDISWAPAWAEDSNTFIYVVQEGGNWKLVRSNISGGGKTYITRNSIGKWDTVPNIRNHVILCSTLINNKRQIVSLNDDGTEVTVLGEGSWPSWHPKGGKYIFIRDGNIFEMDLKTNQATQLFSEKDYECRVPSYSPDGKYILFQKESSVGLDMQTSSSSYSFKKETIRWHLYTIRADGTNLTQLTSGNVDVYGPSWGVDNTIFFVSNAGGHTEIWKAKVTLD